MTHRLLIVAMLTWLGGCEQSSASEAECQAIFDRIVEIEIGEMGFADPALTTHTQNALRSQFRDVIAQCVGRPLPPGAMTCIAKANSAEYLSHRCLH